MDKPTIANHRVRLTDDSLNAYGSRILTTGLDISQYFRNPVLLYMHQRGTVIGNLVNIEKTESEITAELAFDMATDLSRQCAEQWEAGSLRMVSVGVDILEMSEDPSLLLPGQTSPTITKSRLFEVSLVDIGANDNAIVLRKDCPADNSQVVLTALPPLSTLTTKTDNMNLKELALALGIKEDATEEQVLAAAKAVTQSLADAMKALEDINSRQVEKAVDDAITLGKIKADARDNYIECGRQLGPDALADMLDAIAEPQKPATATLTRKPETASIVEKVETKPSAKTRAELAAKWDKMDHDGTLADFRANDPEGYAELFNAKFHLAH